MNEKTAKLEWTNGQIPVSIRFDDPYYSLDDGLEETRHVFLAGNDLPARFKNGFHIAELGFGTGLNFLTTLDCFRKHGAPGKLRYTSFEAYPMTAADIEKALSPFAHLELNLVVSMVADNRTEIEIDDLQFRLITGDARTTLPSWQDKADAWFLDGFSPAKNPELWGEELMSEVARHTRPQGSFATYTAAGTVRRALSEAGFTVERVPGFGRKRHMTRGFLE